MIMQIYSAVPGQKTPGDESKDQAVPRDSCGGRVPYRQGTARAGLPLVDEQKVGDEECGRVA
jgi:hypothetical protein